MKYILLSFMRIKDDFCNQPFLMSLYVIGTSLCVMIFSIFWCNVPALIQKYQENSESQKKYSIIFQQPYDINSTELDFLNKYGLKDITAIDFNNEKHSVTSDNSITLPDVHGITIILNDIIPDTVHAELVKDLSDYLDTCHYSANVVTPYSEPTSRNEISDIVRKISEISIIYIVCLIGCASLFKYIFDVNAYENIIYAMVGASKKKVMLTAVSESIILNFCCSAAAVALNILLKDNLLQDAFDYKIVYNFADYSFIMLSTIMLSVIIMVPFFIKYLKDPIIKIKREL